MTDTTVQVGDDEGDEPRLLDLDEAAARGKMSRRTLQRRIADKIIPVARHGGRGGRLRTMIWSDDMDLYWKQLRCTSYKDRRKRRRKQG